MQSARRKQTAFPSRGIAATKRELSADQRQEIQEAFDLFDAHQNRALDFHTLRAAMRALGFELKKAEVLQILDENDTTQQGVMTWEAFEQVMTQMILDRDPLEEVRRAFHLFDEDNTGIITIKNLRKVARELNENIDESELQAMIEEFDLDQDGGSEYNRKGMRGINEELLTQSTWRNSSPFVPKTSLFNLMYFYDTKVVPLVSF